MIVKCSEVHCLVMQLDKSYIRACVSLPHTLKQHSSPQQRIRCNFGTECCDCRCRFAAALRLRTPASWSAGSARLPSALRTQAQCSRGGARSTRRCSSLHWIGFEEQVKSRDTALYICVRPKCLAHTFRRTCYCYQCWLSGSGGRDVDARWLW